MLNTRELPEAMAFMAEVNWISHGRLRISEDPDWGRGSLSLETDAVRTMQRNRYDLAMVPVRPFHALGVTSFDALIAPLTIDSIALKVTVLESSCHPS